MKVQYILVIAMMLFYCISYAQSPAPAPQGAPIDGGVLLLAGAGVAYGISRMRNKNKEEKTAE